MRTLLVYPSFPKTYWGMEYALPLTGRRALLPPLGLLTVAALLPDAWEVRLVDMSVEPLTDEDLAWADVVFVGAMQIQRDSYHAVIHRAHDHGKTVVVGGAYATTDPDASSEADCVVIGESESLIPTLCQDLERGALAGRYSAAERPDVTKSPIPRFDLLRPGAYSSLGVQFSRGCPFNCEFCDIIEVFGRVPRTKPAEQLIAEFEAIRATGYHGALFVVDDNFIGNKAAAKRMLPVVAEWMRKNDYPFDLFTEASIDLASHDKLIGLMLEAGFSSVFIGIETPSRETLIASQKRQNAHLDLATSVQKLTRAGLEVMAGFIVGFDEDDEDTFERQRAFIQESPIPLAMVGILTALPQTQLWRRLEKEGRLLADYSGDQFGRTNFETRMPESTLVAGYAQLLSQLYDPEAYFARCFQALRLLPDKKPSTYRNDRWFAIATIFRVIWYQGVRAAHRAAFWRHLRRVILHEPRQILRAIEQAIGGAHVIRYTAEDVLPRLAQASTRERISATRNARSSRPVMEETTALDTTAEREEAYEHEGASIAAQ